MNARRIETTRAARELAEQRLDAEQKRFEVGMSTSFLVIQAQRDLAQAKTNELSAVLAYDLSLVDFEALQQAAPAGQATSTSSQQTAATVVATAPPVPPEPAPRRPTTGPLESSEDARSTVTGGAPEARLHYRSRLPDGNRERRGSAPRSDP